MDRKHGAVLGSLMVGSTGVEPYGQLKLGPFMRPESPTRHAKLHKDPHMGAQTIAHRISPDILLQSTLLRYLFPKPGAPFGIRGINLLCLLLGSLLWDNIQPGAERSSAGPFEKAGDPGGGDYEAWYLVGV